jgi:hypothetical protein
VQHPEFKSQYCKKKKKVKEHQLCVQGEVEHICNPSACEAEVEGSRIQDKHRLHKKTLSQKKPKPIPPLPANKQKRHTNE